MRRFTPFFVLLAAALLPRPAAAVQAPHRAAVPGSSADPAAASGALVAAAGTPALRREVSVRYGAAPGRLGDAWSTFVADTADARWIALWDTGTHRPLRIFGGSIPAPGTSAKSAAAEAHARDFLARHAALLLAGRPVSDLDLATNDDDGGLRTVAFQQMTFAGSTRIPVEGGRVNLRYKADRLFVLGAEALPVAPLPAPQIDAASAETAALDYLSPVQPGASVTGSRLVALPLVRARSHRVVLTWRVSTASASPPSRTEVYVDARDGSVVATQEGIRFLTGSLAYEAPIRSPEEYALFPAARAHVVADGKQLSADTSGGFTFDEGATSLACFARSNFISVLNEDGDEASLPIDPVDGVSVEWSQKDDELGDAQLSAFIHGSIAKERARELDPSLSFLNASLKIKVNQYDPEYACNAFFNGVDLNFFQEHSPCHNTARLADVVYHEFGHAFHFQSVLPSVGMYDSALSEGAADYFASIITSDPYLSPGFFMGGGYLREFDTDHVWPDDIHWDPHETGLIFAGALWDLRTILTDEIGPEEGPALAHQLYRGAIRRAPSIPTTFPEVLATDDDDGDLGNGTPHVCQILRAFAPHGLTPYLTSTGLAMQHEPLRVLPSQADPYDVRVKLTHAFPECAKSGDDVGSLDVVWRTQSAQGTVALSKDGDGYAGQIPGQPSGTQMRYAVRAVAEGRLSRIPQNIADPEYKVFVGEVTPLYCTDFEAGAADWVFGAEDNKITDFEWGTPLGAGGDPPSAYSGVSLIGTKLNTVGRYRKERTSFATGPIVELGDRQHVRLQLMRWLTVEDGYFDQAAILVNGQSVWRNQGTDEEDGSLTHEDLEWRFEDIDLSQFTQGGIHQVQVSFQLTSDEGTEYGGWNIDDVCVMAWEPPPPVVGEGGGGAGGGGEGGSGGAGPGADDTAVSCSCRAASPAPGSAPWALLGAALALRLLTRRRR